VLHRRVFAAAADDGCSFAPLVFALVMYRDSESDAESCAITMKISVDNPVGEAADAGASA